MSAPPPQARGAARRRPHPLREGVRTLHPGYFALVMATGIVSIGMRNERAIVLSVALLWLAVFAYTVLLALNGWRLTSFRSEVLADLHNPHRAFGLFTFVAGTDVLGSRLTVDSHHNIGFVLLAVAFITWVVLGYLVPWTALLRYPDRPVLHEANGSWFIAVVASQSLAVLAAALEPDITHGRRELALLAVFAWSIGVFLYVGNGVLVAARTLIYPLTPEELIPPYWVSMGSAAITVVAGARIVEMADAPMVAATRGLIAGTCVLFWAFASWLIPPLVGAGIWRHVVRKVPLVYEPTLWSIVFPLGMYGVASSFLGQADHLPILRGIGDVESWIALAAWVVVATGMLQHFVRSWMHHHRSHAAAAS